MSKAARTREIWSWGPPRQAWARTTTGTSGRMRALVSSSCRARKSGLRRSTAYFRRLSISYSWTPRRPSTSARVGPAENCLGLLVHALPVGRIGGRPGGDAPPAGEELIQRRQVDDGRMGDCFELGIERGDVGGGQGRAYGGEGPLDVRMGPVVSLDGHDEA